MEFRPVVHDFSDGYKKVLSDQHHLLTNSFSIKEIDVDRTTLIPAKQQMIIYGPLKIRGQLKVKGSLVLLPEKKQTIPVIPVHKDNFSYRNIEQNVIIEVLKNQEMIVSNFIKIRGELKVNGKLTIVSTKRPRILTIADCVPPYIIEEDTIYIINTNKILNNPRFLKVRGTIKNRGYLMIGGR
jgi:hypothetical protein